MAYYELKITAPPASWSPIITMLSEKGSLGFIETEESLVAYFTDTFNMDKLARQLEVLSSVLNTAGLPHRLQFSYSLIPGQDWNESWKKGFVPLNVGKQFTILPPWEKPHPDRINLIIDPGMAFGTGHHETTRSCLVLMENYDGQVAKDRFLDIGTGTGLLAIAASKLGYREILAVDTDPLATEAARMNINLNNAANIDVREGSVDAAPGTFDCIVANIISGVLILLAPDIASRLKPGGIAILSGILAEQSEEVIAQMKNNGLFVRGTCTDDKWVSLVLTHERSLLHRKVHASKHG